jgi:acetyltransferase-like isoleucine patch superfamily enzyme
MPAPPNCVLLEVPREGVNDDVVRVLEWLAADGAEVSANQAVVVLETTKVTFEVEAPGPGFLFHLAAAGAEVPVGGAVGLISSRPERPPLPNGRPSPPPTVPGDQVITQKALALIEEHGIPLTHFAGMSVVRSSAVEAVIRERDRAPQGGRPRVFRGETLDAAADWDAVRQTGLHRELTALLTALRKRMKAKYDRHVSTCDLLHDRWELAREHGFGEGTSVYDDCLILGDVNVGRHCWVGPGTILDGQGGLTVGDYVDIGAGTHLYSHNTIERALTGHRAPVFKKATVIGNCCFIAPRVTVAPGTVIGDHCFVAVGSYVEGVFPPFSSIAGNPARRVGVVELNDNRVRIRPVAEGPEEKRSS